LVLEIGLEMAMESFDCPHPFAFLSSSLKEARHSGIRQEVFTALNRERETALNRERENAVGKGILRTFFRILFNPQGSDAKIIKYLELAYDNIDDLVSRDATEKLASTLERKEWFCLYLRPFAAESILELAYQNDSLSIYRSI